ncbi:MAG: nitroreductase family protein, partial [Acidimicrobiia bacterium]
MSFSTVPYVPISIPDSEQLELARAVFDEMDQRRSVREFSDRPVPRELVVTAIRCASTAPSGAHMQPWTFVLVGDPEVKR